ncbi:MAG TPA: nucleoside deaminase [Pseudonocardiaceae bacterium]
MSSIQPGASPRDTHIDTSEDEMLAAYMRQAVQLSLENVRQGGVPFSAVIVDPLRGVVGTGVNRVIAERDSLAHAEVVAMRDACSRRSHLWLAGCIMFASGEPCALCYTAALWSNVSRILYAVDRYQAAEAGFDYVSSYDLFATQPAQWPIEVRAFPVEGALEPFEEWRRMHGRR